MRGKDVIFEVQRLIGAGYDDLGHSLGWTFLFSPMSTLRFRPPIMVVGVNPGGAEHRPPRLSYEDGNRFSQKATHGRDKYGAQLREMFKHIAAALGDRKAWHQILDATLTLNFCPFRSPSWSALHAPARTVRFCRSLWDFITPHVQPFVTLCIGDAYSEVKKAYLRDGFKIVGDRELIPIGWGRCCFRRRTLVRGHHSMTIFYIPHLSWVRPFGKEQYREPCDRLSRRIVNCLPEHASDVWLKNQGTSP